MKAFTTKGADSSDALIPPFSDYVNSYLMVASTAQTVTWPPGSKFCSINSLNDYYCRVGGTATVPSATVTDGTASAYNPSQRSRGDTEVSFSIISPTAQTIVIEFWGGSNS